MKMKIRYWIIRWNQILNKVFILFLKIIKFDLTNLIFCPFYLSENEIKIITIKILYLLLLNLLI